MVGWLVGCFNSECFSANEQSSVLGQINIASKSWATFNVLQLLQNVKAM